MLTLLYAPEATARREALQALLQKHAERKEKVLLFVPEQQVLESEGFLSSLASGNMMEVSSFKRIANSIFREYGGLRYHYIGKGAKQVVMWRALSSVSSALKEYANVSSDDLSMLRLLVATVEEMKLYGISPEQLEKGADELNDEKLARKLSDIALLYAAYNMILHEKHDDASDDLWRAAKTCEGKGFFADTHIILDSFDGYTHEEIALLRVIFREARSVTATLAYDKSDRRKIFLRLKETDRLLRSLADELSLSVEEKTLASFSEKSEIAYFAKYIFQRSVEDAEQATFGEYPPESGGIRAIRCPGVYEEARFVASDIARRVIAGARYRDFAIVTRNTDRYLGILDAALEGAGIPYFLSARKDVTAMPLVRMLFCALDILNYNWRCEDVIAYMRCGLTGLSAEECDMIEEYASIWRITGKRWHDEYGWQMNPNGFSLDFTEEAAERLVLINALKERLVRPLVAFFEAFSLSATVKSISAALVNYLHALKIPDLLASRVESNAALFADRTDRDDYALLYDCLLSSLDQLVEVAGDVAVSSREYSRLLLAILAEADIGRLPSRCDEVTVGNADLLRKSDTKNVYVIGLCQGEFPSSDFEKGCFDGDEKEALAAIGIETSPDTERRIADEKLFFYRSVTSAGQSATLSYAYRDSEGKEKFPSSAFSDTLALLTGRKVEEYDALPSDALLYGAPEIYEYAIRHGYHLTGKDLPETANFALTQPLSAENEEIPSGVVSTLFGKKISLSQSKMDKFVLCPFAYHCAYSLRLAPEASGDFESVDVGNFIHKIFEEYFSRIKGQIKTIESKEAKKILDEVVDAYVASLRRGNGSKRFEALIGRLRRTTNLLVWNLLSEFRASDFEPAFFELPISPTGERGVVSETIPISDTQSIVFKGVVDRVDIFRKGKDVYFRIVDYKIGNKEFSMNDILMGLNMQMLLYLFTLSSDQNGSFAKMVGCEGELIPAGVLYFSFGSQSRVKEGKGDKRPLDFDEALARTEKRIMRSGVLLNDKEILTAMENTLEGRYLPITVNKSGKVDASSKATTLSTLEELGTLAETVRKTVVAIANELMQGKAKATPVKKGQHDPCKFCKMKPICRTEKTEGQEEQEEGGES